VPVPGGARRPLQYGRPAAIAAAAGDGVAAQRERRPEREREIGRLEAFSDGVFAIAVTLLILDLRVPEASGDHALLTALARQWPNYLAFVASFATILVMWINHHAMFRAVWRSDHWLYVFNGLLLLVVSAIPFPTSLVAEYLTRDGSRVAAVVFSSTYLLLAIVFNLLWRYIVHHPELHDARVNPEWVQSLSRRYRFGPALYLVGLLLALLNVYACLAVALGLAVLFLLPLGVDHFLPEDHLAA
jgi:uncharacterized membrane protein